MCFDASEESHLLLDTPLPVCKSHQCTSGSCFLVQRANASSVNLCEGSDENKSSVRQEVNLVTAHYVLILFLIITHFGRICDTSALSWLLSVPHIKQKPPIKELEVPHLRQGHDVIAKASGPNGQWHVFRIRLKVTFKVEPIIIPGGGQSRHKWSCWVHPAVGKILLFYLKHEPVKCPLST